MIRIRYCSELQPGLNGQAERLGRITVVYLLPGLSSAQRAAALRRLRQHGRMGISPRLPLPQLLAALLADRIKTAFGQAGAIVRIHPAGSTLPVMAVSAAVAGFLLLSALSIRIAHTPLAGGPPAIRGPVPAASGQHGRGNGSEPGQPGGRPVRGAGAHAPGGATPGAGWASTGPGTTLSSTAPSAPSVPSPGAASSPSPPVPASVTPPGETGPPGSVCVNLGSFGICLGL